MSFVNSINPINPNHPLAPSPYPSPARGEGKLFGDFNEIHIPP